MHEQLASLMLGSATEFPHFQLLFLDSIFFIIIFFSFWLESSWNPSHCPREYHAANSLANGAILYAIKKNLEQLIHFCK